MSNVNDFKTELKALLKKYDANISFNVSECSDTHGLHGERIEVDFYGSSSVTLADGWCVSPSDL